MKLMRRGAKNPAAVHPMSCCIGGPSPFRPVPEQVFKTQGKKGRN